jgi:hypothetical protein
MEGRRGTGYSILYENEQAIINQYIYQNITRLHILF